MHMNFQYVPFLICIYEQKRDFAEHHVWFVYCFVPCSTMLQYCWSHAISLTLNLTCIPQGFSSPGLSAHLVIISLSLLSFHFRPGIWPCLRTPPHSIWLGMNVFLDQTVLSILIRWSRWSWITWTIWENRLWMLRCPDVQRLYRCRFNINKCSQCFLQLHFSDPHRKYNSESAQAGTLCEYKTLCTHRRA